MRRALSKGMRDEWEFQQYEREETLELFGPSKAIWDPRMMVFAEVDGELAGVAVGWPDWTPLIPIAPRPGGPDRHADGVAQLAQDGACGPQGIAVLPGSMTAASVPRCSLASSPGSRRWGSRASTST